ncbi:MAG: hypothetical protein M1830_002459 [Pleopsidium flavum]|nr:MAG: hypothetical protein M1830_002459 [Pleopsidium flavum]
MSYTNRSFSSHLRAPSVGNTQPTVGQSPMLLARINEKRTELENLKQLRDLSAGLAGQMQTLEEKLATLASGTEAVAAVLANWHNVLRAINMASMKIPKPKTDTGEEAEADAEVKTAGQDVPLPQTLVRIPTQQDQALSEPEQENGRGSGG